MTDHATLFRNPTTSVWVSTARNVALAITVGGLPIGKLKLPPPQIHNPQPKETSQC